MAGIDDKFMEKPDTTVDAKRVFGVDFRTPVPAFSKPNEYVPAIDSAYRFDPQTTRAILAGFAYNRRVMVQGYHGTGKSPTSSKWRRASIGRASASISTAIRLPARTTLNGIVAVGWWNQNVSLLPFTINSVNANVVPLPRGTAQAKANTATVFLNFVSRPSRYFDVSARYRLYDFDNQTAAFILARESGLPDRVTADGAPGVWSDPSIGKIGPEPLGYRRNYFDLDTGITGVPNTTFRLGYGHYAADTHFRVYENVGENTFRAGADVVGNQYVSFRSVPGGEGLRRAARRREADRRRGGPPPVLRVAAGLRPAADPGCAELLEVAQLRIDARKALDTILDYAGRLPSPASEIFVAQLGGATNRVTSNATAYPHRDAEFVMNVHTRWEDAKDDEKCVSWARTFFDATAGFSTGGVYVNFISDGEDRVEAAYGSNYDRVAKVKKRYDPDNLFCVNQNVAPARA